MKKIEAIIRKTKFEEVKAALLSSDIDWFEYHDVHGIGQSRQERIYRGVQYSTDVIDDTWSIRTGENGDTVLRDKK